METFKRLYEILPHDDYWILHEHVRRYSFAHKSEYDNENDGGHNLFVT